MFTADIVLPVCIIIQFTNFTFGCNRNRRHVDCFINNLLLHVISSISTRITAGRKFSRFFKTAYRRLFRTRRRFDIADQRRLFIALLETESHTARVTRFGITANMASGPARHIINTSPDKCFDERALKVGWPVLLTQSSSNHCWYTTRKTNIIPLLKCSSLLITATEKYSKVYDFVKPTSFCTRIDWSWFKFDGGTDKRFSCKVLH